MKETAKALISKNKNELPEARKLYVCLDKADNVIEGGPPFETVLNFRVADPSRFFEGSEGLVFRPCLFLTQLTGSTRINPCFRFEKNEKLLQGQSFG